jgi:hypothetical protein
MLFVYGNVLYAIAKQTGNLPYYLTHSYSSILLHVFVGVSVRSNGRHDL